MALSLTDINVGSAPNDGTGDTLRAAFQTVNANNTTLESTIGELPEGTAILSTGPVTDGYVLTADGAGGAVWEAASGGGAFTADGNTLITPTTAIVLDQDTGDEVALTLNYTTNKATSGNDTGLLINQTDTLSPGTSLLADFQVGGVSQAYIENSGVVHGTRFYGSTGASSANDGIKVISGGISVIRNDTTEVLNITAEGTASVQGISATSNYPIGWCSGTTTKGTFDTKFYREGAGVVGQHNTTNPQTFNIYNTRTDASNYERGFARWNTDVFEVGSEAAGTGTARDTKIITASGNLYFEQTTGNDFDVFFNTPNGVQFVQNTDVTVGHMWAFQSSATAEVISSSAAQATVFIDGDCRQSGTAAYDALLVDGTLETNGDGSAGDGNNILRLTNAATTQFKVATDGVITADAVGHTVAGLPASPAVGMIARVTDASSPTVGSTVTGGGAAAALVWYDGTNWVVTGGAAPAGSGWSNMTEAVWTGGTQSEVADGASAVAFAFDTDAAYSTAGAKLLSLKNNTAEKFSVDKDGVTTVANDLVLSENGTDVYISQGVGAGYFQVFSGTGTESVRMYSSQVRIGGNQLQFGTNLGTQRVELVNDSSTVYALGLRGVTNTNPTTFNVYNTYTDASNYERGFVRWNSNVLQIGSEAAGTGTARELHFVGPEGGNQFLKFLQTGYVTVSATNTSDFFQILIAGTAKVSFGNTRFYPNTDSSYENGITSNRWSDVWTDKLGITNYAHIDSGYTVATLPGTPAVGMIARVTDANSPAVGSTVAGSGSSPAMVWYNGTNWTVIGV